MKPPPPKKPRLDSRSSYLPSLCSPWNSESIVNVENREDEQCFKWSVLAALHPTPGADAVKVSCYRNFQDQLKFDDLKFPISIADIPLFEKKNKIRINVYSYNKFQKVFPAYTSQRVNPIEIINLLLLYNDKKQHYCWIRDVRLFLTDNNTSSYCPYCLTCFDQNYPLDDHQRLCERHGRQVVTMPRRTNSTLSLSSSGYRQKVTFVIYADFECILEPIQRRAENVSDNDQKVLSIHKPCGYSYKIVGSKPELSRAVKFYRGEDAAEKFVLDLLEEETWILNKMKDLNCSGKIFIPVVFHNGNRYDSHLIIQILKKIKEKQETVQFSCLPLTMQEFISFNIGSFRFIDSYRFLKDSLHNLVTNLQQSSTGDEEIMFKNTSELTKDMSESKEKLRMLLRKQVYPYEYMDSHDKFKCKSLPPIEDFYSSVKFSEATEEDYEHAKNVWKTFNINTIGDYHDLYIQNDVLLLADVFENFRKSMLDHYDLDPAHFYSVPRLALQAALEGVKLELFTDLDMHLMIESGIRGGVAMVSRRHSKANNPKVSNFDEHQPKTWIIYLDANNLNGWAMTQPLPKGNFKWLSNEEINALDIQRIKDADETGYILEVDLEYPNDLHEDHNDFPLAPEKIELTSEMLSPYCKTLFEELDMKEPTGDRLIPNLRNKHKYVVHYRTLKLYLKLGMKLTKVYRVLSFQQTTWLEPYISKNTQRRRESTSDVQKDFFKLMNNSVYGKTIENLRNYDKETEFLFSDNELAKAKMRPNFQDCMNVDGTRIAQFKKTSLYLNKPIYAGFAILDLAKLFIYDFHYNRIRVKYGDKAKLLFTDTDSLCYEVETEDIYKDMEKDKDLYDFSKYPKDHPLFSDKNKNVVGRMKDVVYR